MVNYHLAELIEIFRPNLLKLDLFCTQISLALVILVKMGGLSDRKTVLVETIKDLCGYWIFLVFIVF